ncbi:MAG TPA: DUF2079 domain-containing protein [Candidatus Cybelea sp.]|jgi:uncharacterized membrane protein|nr:DUF2079 domain-containing protein [Candidatus Cybelea sp.]
MRANAVAAACSLALAAALGAIVQWRYAIFRNGVDLGIFTQVIAALGHGFSSTAEGGTNHLLVHWSPIIVTGWPLLRAFGPVGLEYFQAVLVAATLLPVWGLARARFGQTAALGIVAVAALYPILWANGVGDFHEMAFVPLLSATFVYALDRRRWTLSLVAAVLLCCTKEDQFVVLAFNGVVFAATMRGDVRARRIGWTIAGVAIAMSLLYFGPIRHALNPHAPYLSLGFFDWSAVGDGGHLTDALWRRAAYILMLLAPLAFLPCISRYGVFLIPGLVEIFASSRPVTLAPGAHYSALLTGYALAGFVDGASRLTRRRPRLVPGIVAATAAVSIGIGIFASPMEYWYYLYRRPNAHDTLLEQTLARLPACTGVGAEDEIFAHLALNPNASIDFAGQRWFVYDATHYSQRWYATDRPAVRHALAHHTYTVATERDGIVVLRRSDQGGGGLAPGGGQLTGGPGRWPPGCGAGKQGGRFGNGAGL